MSTDELSGRIQKTKFLIEKKGLKGIIAFSSYPEKEGNVYYLVNHHNFFPPIANDEYYCGLGYSALVLDVEGDPVLIAPLGYDKEKVGPIKYAKTGHNLVNDLIDVLEDLNLTKGSIGIAGTDIIPYAYYKQLREHFPQVNFIPVDDILLEQRMVKSPEEIKILKNAAQIAERCMKATLRYVTPGLSEWEISAYITKLSLKEGVEYIARTRVHSGPSAGSLKWPMVSKRTINEGEFVTIDFIGWYQGYAFDIMGSTVAGQGEERQYELINLSKKATVEVCQKIKPGIKASELAASLSSLRESTGMKIDFFGHGIGIEVVENPVLHPQSDFSLLPGMVLCIEPSIEIGKGSKICFEEEVLVTSNGCEMITNLTGYSHKEEEDKK